MIKNNSLARAFFTFVHFFVALRKTTKEREIAKIEVLSKTSALEDIFSSIFFFSPKLGAVPTSVIFDELPHPCHIKKVETVTK